MMKRIDLYVTDELWLILNRLAPGDRGALIEGELWKSRKIKTAAHTLDLDRQPRTTKGRPPKQKKRGTTHAND